MLIRAGDQGPRRNSLHQSCYAGVRYVLDMSLISDNFQNLPAAYPPCRCKEGKMKERKQTLNERRVVGVTCASTRQEILSSQEFPILILDESSQEILFF